MEKLKNFQATTHQLSGRDFGEPKKKILNPYTPKQIIIQKSTYQIECKKCGKKNWIPPGPIENTTNLYCQCGAKIGVLADKEYGEKRRKSLALKQKSLENSDLE